jgi:hypothetical protein
VVSVKIMRRRMLGGGLAWFYVLEGCFGSNNGNMEYNFHFSAYKSAIFKRQIFKAGIYAFFTAV